MKAIEITITLPLQTWEETMGEVAEEPCDCPIICEDVQGQQAEVCDSFDPIAESILGEGYDGFDLFEQWFVTPNGLGTGEPNTYEFDIYDE